MNNQSDLQSLSRKEREKLRNKEVILEAAVHLFAQKGFNDTKLEEVAALAEFGKGTLYNYFENKHDLLLSALMFAMDRVTGYLNDQLKSVSDPLERIRLIVKSQFDYYQNHADFLHVVMAHQRILAHEAHSGEGHNQDLRKRFSVIREMLINELQTAMDQNRVKPGDPKRYAAYLTGMIHGQVRSLSSGELNMEQVQPEEILDVFLNGVSYD